jgi:hypothetical protein
LKPVNPTRFLQEPHRFGGGGRDDWMGLETTAADFGTGNNTLLCPTEEQSIGCSASSMFSGTFCGDASPFSSVISSSLVEELRELLACWRTNSV